MRSVLPRFLLPHFHPKASWVHRVPPDAKIVYVTLVLIACWFGVYGRDIGRSYTILLLFLAISFVGVAVASNTKAALRLLLLPAVLGGLWTLLYLIAIILHLREHILGTAKDTIEGTLQRHILLHFALDFRRVVSLFTASMAVALVVVSLSASDLRRAKLIPKRMALNVELFMSTFVRFQWRVRRVLDAHHLSGFQPSPLMVFYPGSRNPLLAIWKGLTIFAISVCRDVASIWNYRALKARLLQEREETNGH